MTDIIKTLSKVKNRKFRKLFAKMWLTSETIKKMEQYHKKHYEN
jgi:hypothetical protein